MKLKIFLALMLPFLCMVASAQNPIAKVFKVEYRTADGVETAVEVATISAANSFGFIGSKGKVDYYNEATGQWESIEEENSDVYLNVTKVDAYSAKLAASFSYNIEEVSFVGINTYGYCISKTPNPQASDSYIKISSGGTVNLQQYFEENGDGCYTLSISNGSKISNSAVEVKGLDYVTTYYVRPFIKFHNGFIMYGGEKSFTTVKTMDAAFAAEEGLEESVRLEDSIVVTKKALSSLLDNEAEISVDLRYGIVQDLNSSFMGNEDKAAILKNAYKTIECVDGNLYLIDKFPAGIMAAFKDNFGKGTEFSAVEMLEHISGAAMTETVYCDASLGVPYNSYLRVQPTASSGNPTIELNIPKYLHAGKEYDIYAVFVHSDITGDTLPNKFIIELQERQPSSESGEKGSYKRTHKSDDYINNVSNSVDTCFVGRYTFLGTPDPMIKISSDVRRTEKEYSRIICISKICIVPVNENE